MGWKLSVVARRSRAEDEPEGLARALGFETAGAESVELGRALYPAPGLAIGRWNDHLILLSETLADVLLAGAELTREKRKLLTALGGSQTMAATLHSVTDLYGFALYEGERLVRGRVGAADDGVIWECGQPLEWEAAFSQEDYDGEQAVFRFLQEVFAAPIDQADDSLFALELRRFRSASVWVRLRRRLGF
jgi:hypothetical protein